MIITEYNNSIKLYEEYLNINHHYVKINIKTLMKEKRTTQKYVAEDLNINKTDFFNMINIANSRQFPFNILLKLCLYFDTDLKTISKEAIYINQKPSSFKKWNDDNISEFMKDYKTMSIQEIRDKWKLSQKSVETYFLKFSKDM